MADDFEEVNVVRSESVSLSPVTEKMPEGDLIYKSEIDCRRSRYPHCIVWTPIPVISWLLPFIGHLGIGTTAGVIRDFAGPYAVAEDHMTFGNTTRYWQLSLEKVPSPNKGEMWDRGVHAAAEEYKGRFLNPFCDNCYSLVSYALNTMKYDNSTSWNMFKIGFYILLRGRYVGTLGFIKCWLPVVIVYAIIIGIILYFKA